MLPEALNLGPVRVARIAFQARAMLAAMIRYEIRLQFCYGFRRFFFLLSQIQN
jgi:hypothetical protein